MAADNMSVTIEKDMLVIKIKMVEPALSATGKTMGIASSHGNQKTGCILQKGPGKGKEITVGVNAYYKP